ncbi:hypothetical protein NDU88_001500 [Pleurodeles waltl]|uniref:Uncharacterized protein n=1 Tax=Pleurodeles waltl TaxID=8319 RepID=A0AAV7WNT0_PLEWA|nr:hypothetical protein NDU88_001500 [Pleurodeles waltl]
MQQPPDGGWVSWLGHALGPGRLAACGGHWPGSRLCYSGGDPRHLTTAPGGCLSCSPRALFCVAAACSSIHCRMGSALSGGALWSRVLRRAQLVALICAWFAIGRSDARQQKLQFGAKKLTGVPSECMEGATLPPPQGEQSDMGEMKALLLTMQSSLSSIDSKMDTMTTRLDLLLLG